MDTTSNMFTTGYSYVKTCTHIHIQTHQQLVLVMVNIFQCNMNIIIASHTHRQCFGHSLFSLCDTAGNKIKKDSWHNCYNSTSYQYYYSRFFPPYTLQIYVKYTGLKGIWLNHWEKINSGSGNTLIMMPKLVEDNFDI